MAHEALARKLRPRTFEEVVGQEAIVQTLRNAIETGRIHPAYIFSGIRGVGKTTVARIVAKGLNCKRADRPTPKPCGSCESCVEIARGVSMDVLEIDGATHTGVDEARDLTQIAQYNPARDRFRIFIIDEVHMLSNSAFNALLKTLEEPPSHVVFLLATTLPHKIPETIHSRAQHFEFRRVPPSRLAAFLTEVCAREEIDIEPGALDLLSRAGDGSVRDSLTLLDRMIAYADGTITETLSQELLGVVGRDFLFSFVEAVAAFDARALLVGYEEILNRGHDLPRFLQDLAGHVRRLVRERTAASSSPPGEPEELSARFRKQASAFSPEDLFRLQDLLLNTLSRLRGAPDPESLVELQLVKAAHLPRILPLQEVLAGMESGVGRAVPHPSRPASPPVPGNPGPSPSLQPEEPRPAPDEGAGSGLRFTSLVPFQRMDAEEERSYTGGSERAEAFRAEIVKEFPLARPALEGATLSVEDGRVLHVALPSSQSVGLVLLNTPERMEILQRVAREAGFEGGAVLERRDPDPLDNEGRQGPADDLELARNHPAVKKIQSILGGQVIGVRVTAPEEPGDEDVEPEQDP